MVSRIKTDDGRCLNVSLPDDVADGLEQDGEDRMTVRGDVLGYPDAAGTLEYQVDDRSVGKGDCGEDLLFVATPSDVCVGEDAKCRQDGFSNDESRTYKPHTVRAVPPEQKEAGEH
jgi:hypothetical protein